MSNWKILGNIATLFAIAFTVFAVFQAIITYEAYLIENQSRLVTERFPSDYILVATLSSILWLLLFAVLSFLVAGVALRAVKETPKAEELPAQPEAPSEPKE